VAGECNAVTPAMHAALAKLDPYPACIQSAKYDVLAYNRGYNYLIDDFDQVPLEDRNCMWLAFTDPRWRKRVVDWADTTARMVANLRVLMGEHVGDASWKSFVNRLTAASPEFAELWARHEVRGFENKAKRYRHPDVGLMTFDVTTTWLAPRTGRRMLVYVPADADSERRITRLVEMSACS
jgi:hypothetical protein